MDTPPYRYQVVTNCGAGVWSKLLTFPKALKALAFVMANHDYDDFELQRAQDVWSDRVGRGRRYWLRRDGDWREYASDDRVFSPTDDDYGYWRERVEQAMSSRPAR